MLYSEAVSKYAFTLIPLYGFVPSNYILAEALYYRWGQFESGWWFRDSSTRFGVLISINDIYGVLISINDIYGLS